MKSVKKRKKRNKYFCFSWDYCEMQRMTWLKQYKWQNAISNKWMLIKGSDDSECMGNTLYIFIMIQVSLVHFPVWIPKCQVGGKNPSMFNLL